MALSPERRQKAETMHPYHIKEVTNERTASMLRSANQRRLVAEARASREPDDPCAQTPAARRGFRIPLFRWELRMQPMR
jgi:hypothetical protein